MSEENLDVIRTAFDAWNRGDLKAFVGLFTPDATWYPLEDWPDSQICRGREEIERLLRQAREPLERVNAAPEELVESGDHVVVDQRWGGVIRGTEDEVDMRMGMVLAFREGKIAEWRMFKTFNEALEAVGVRRTTAPDEERHR